MLNGSIDENQLLKIQDFNGVIGGDNLKNFYNMTTSLNTLTLFGAIYREIPMSGAIYGQNINY